jgi:hypothetical protein
MKMKNKNINVQEFFIFIKDRCSSREYKKFACFNIVDVILEYCNRMMFDDDMVFDLVELIKQDKMIYEFIEIEAKRKRIIIDRDYNNKSMKSLNGFNRIGKKNLLSIFRKN